MFWLYLILRIAKNYVFADHLDDERSEDEEEDEDPGQTIKDAKKALLEGPKVNGSNKPVVLLNGEPVEGENKPDAVRERKRKG